MDESKAGTREAEKKRVMWVILGGLALVIGVALYLVGRSKGPKAFDIDSLRKRFFGGGDDAVADTSRDDKGAGA